MAHILAQGAHYPVPAQTPYPGVAGWGAEANTMESTSNQAWYSSQVDVAGGSGLQPSAAHTLSPSSHQQQPVAPANAHAGRMPYDNSNFQQHASGATFVTSSHGPGLPPQNMYHVQYSRADTPGGVRINAVDPSSSHDRTGETLDCAQLDSQLRDAHQLYREQQYHAALQICQRVHSFQPERTDCLLLMGAVHFHLRNYQQSVQCNDMCILLDPSIVEAHANLANTLQQMGHLAMAALYYQTAVRLRPNFTDACVNLANVYVQMGQAARAIELYMNTLRVDPSIIEVHQNLGDLWLSQGAQGRAHAQKCFSDALGLNPKYAPAWRGLGDVLREMGDAGKAVSCYTEAVAHRQDYVEALTGLGLCLKELGRLQEAEATFASVLQLQPDSALALGNLAGLYYDTGKLQNAVTAYQRAIQLQPNFPEAYNNLGNALRELGRADEAIACYTACIQLQYAQQHAAGTNMSQVAATQAQRLSVAYSNLGGILKMQGRSLEAIACYEHVALLQPTVPEVHANVAAAYKDAARHDQAIHSYMRALQLKHDFPEAFANLVHSLQSVCDWRDRASLFARLEGEVRRSLANDELPAVQPFHAMSYPFSTDLALEISRRYAKHCALSAAALGVPPFQHPEPRPLRPGERLRVAYVSSDFGNHPLSHLMGSVFGMHDRGRVEVFCYALSPSDNTEWRNRIAAETEHFLDVSAWSVPDIAARIHSDGIQVAVNLNGYTKGARNEIFALRPAPVQCSYMGFPATTGQDFCPYLITDAVVAPPHLHHAYSECLALMPHCYFVNDYKQAHMDILDEAALPKRADFGLPDDKLIFSCSNQLYKYDPDTFNTWMNVLKRVPNSVLWLLRFPAYGEPRIYAEAERRGVSASRVIFTDVAQKNVHIARSGLADVFLDTPLCNAHTTGCDVLWGAAPTVTLPLERMASRVCASLCMATGLGDEMVVHSQAQYEELAVELGLNHEKRLSLRSRLKAVRTTCPLFDTARWVRNLERVFAMMWRLHCDGTGPRTFSITEEHPLPGDAPSAA